MRVLKFLMHSFQVRNRNQVNGKSGTRRVRLNPRTQDVKDNVVYFGSNKLKEAGGLLPEVQRQSYSRNSQNKLINLTTFLSWL
jgi:energy-converting hydrogenase Eha subunit F